MRNRILVDKIQKNFKPYIVAEISANHNGSIEKALRLIELAKEAGVDAVKLQTYTPDTMTLDCDKDDFKIKDGPWKGYTLYELYKEAHTPWEWHEALFKKARDLNLTIFSTPFDETAVDFLEGLNVPAYKIASFELTDLPLIEYVAKTGKPIIMSTGMANINEIQDAVDTVKQYHNDIILLHCISSYPAPIEQSNLLTIPDMAKRFNVKVGLSDHTLGTVAAVTSIALGACFIEKHFIENRNDKGPDSHFSLEPHEMQKLVDETKQVWKALGKVDYSLKDAEKDNVVFRRSLYFVKDMKKGDIITEDCVRRIRPGYGMQAKNLRNVLGKILLVDVSVGTPVSKSLLEV